VFKLEEPSSVSQINDCFFKFKLKLGVFESIFSDVRTSVSLCKALSFDLNAKIGYKLR